VRLRKTDAREAKVEETAEECSTTSGEYFAAEESSRGVGRIADFRAGEGDV